jgi:hypothetical protein
MIGAGRNIENRWTAKIPNRHCPRFPLECRQDKDRPCCRAPPIHLLGNGIDSVPKALADVWYFEIGATPSINVSTYASPAMKVSEMIRLGIPPMNNIPNHNTAASIKTMRVGVGKPPSSAGIMGKKPANNWIVAATAPQNHAQFSFFRNPYNTATQSAPVAVPHQPSTAYTIRTVFPSSSAQTRRFQSGEWIAHNGTERVLSKGR